MPFEIFSIVSDGQRYNCNCTIVPSTGASSPLVEPSLIAPVVPGPAELDFFIGSSGGTSPAPGGGGGGGGGSGGGVTYLNGAPACGPGASDFSSRVIPGGFSNPNVAISFKDPTGRNEYEGVKRSDGRWQTKEEYWNEIVMEAGLKPGPQFGTVNCQGGCPANLSDLLLQSAMANSDRRNVYIGDKSKMENGGDCYAGSDNVVR